jgi:PAP2 superfamily
VAAAGATSRRPPTLLTSVNTANPPVSGAVSQARHRRALLLATVAALAAVGLYTLPRPYPRHIDSVAEWNAIAFDVCSGLGGGTRQSRALAMTHLAIHDALNSIRPVYTTYARGLPRDPKASPEAAVAAAAHDTLAVMAGDHQLQLDKAYEDAIERLPDNAARGEGISLGKAAARAILAMRTDDGADRAELRLAPQPFAPGRYQPTPSRFDPPIVPRWRNVTPFAMRTADQFRPMPPPALDSEQYAQLYNEVKRIGALHSAQRTREQTATAKFWSGDALATWNEIARNVVNARASDRDRSNDLDLWQSAHLFALLDAAAADSFISGWEAKFHYLNWRPITAIRSGDTDGNAATTPDPDWSPLLVTPAHPEYPSTHSILASASATVLQCALGSDAVPFAISSDKVFFGRTRHFERFSEAANEIALSRLYAGAHFRLANTRGLDQGKKIGRHICKTFLPPLATATSVRTRANN